MGSQAKQLQHEAIVTRIFLSEGKYHMCTAAVAQSADGLEKSHPGEKRQMLLTLNSDGTRSCSV
jgi:hypothetical protein